MFNVEEFIQKINLKNKQRSVNKKFKEQGLSDDVLEEQVRINQRRHELDIVDECDLVFGDYVQ